MREKSSISESKFWQGMQDWTKENIDTPLVQNAIKEAQKQFPNGSKIQSNGSNNNGIISTGIDKTVKAI